MPLGLDTPSTIGIATAVIGPVYLETKDAVAAWQVGMATLMIIGIFKLALSFLGDWVRSRIPQAGLLGSLAGIGITLLAFFPLMKIFSAPIAGITALGVILYSIVARRRLPFGIPGAFLAVVAGCFLYYLVEASAAWAPMEPRPRWSFTRLFPFQPLVSCTDSIKLFPICLLLSRLPCSPSSAD